MDDDRCSTMERLATARWSSDLTLKKCRCDVDLLIASGVTALHTNPGAAALVNLRFSMTVSDWVPALTRTIELTARLSHKEKWRLGEPQIRALSKVALRHWLVPVCPVCCGRRFDGIPGTNRLGSHTCHTCLGTGTRPLPKGEGNRLRAILYLLEEDRFNVDSELRRVVR